MHVQVHQSIITLNIWNKVITDCFQQLNCGCNLKLMRSLKQSPVAYSGVWLIQVFREGSSSMFLFYQFALMSCLHCTSKQMFTFTNLTYCSKCLA